MRLPTDPDRTPDINVVALVDVLFAILTFFIVTSLTLTRNEGLPVNLPTAGTGKSQEQTKLVVNITTDGAISMIEGETRHPVELAALVPKIQAAISKNPDSLVIINADERVEHGKVVAVMDRVRQIPSVRLAIATKRG